jgi:hypothetical protein
MQRTPGVFAIVVTACALTLVACSKEADVNPNAPGSPGTGNATEVLRPAAPDGPPGGPSGIAGSAPHPGSSGGDAPVGSTGSGTAGASQSATPGQGLSGGLNADKAPIAGTSPQASAAMGAGAPDGSPNTTSRDAVGRR